MISHHLKGLLSWFASIMLSAFTWEAGADITLKILTGLAAASASAAAVFHYVKQGQLNSLKAEHLRRQIEKGNEIADNE